MVAASWFGVALSTAEGAEAHVAQVYNWQCAVPLQCYLSREMVKDIYYKFIQFSLGIYDGREFVDGSALIGFDWERFFGFARKQTLVGIIMEGISKLPKSVAPTQKLLMNWFMASQGIRRQNWMLNEATVDIYNKVRAAGYDCCILKGQANAAMYPNPVARTPGDVDMWVKASREEIRALAHSLAKENGRVDEESFSHIAITLNGVCVELHYTPGFMANFVYSRRLQRWFADSIEGQCRNMIALPDEVGEVASPTPAFNAVYQCTTSIIITSMRVSDYAKW